MRPGRWRHAYVFVLGKFQRSPLDDRREKPRMTFALSSRRRMSVMLFEVDYAARSVCGQPSSSTAGLSGAIAGRPIMIPMVDNRGLKSNEPRGEGLG